MRAAFIVGKTIVAALVALWWFSVDLSARAQEILLHQGEDRQALLVDGAKKEGQVVIYSAMIANQALRPLIDGFMKTYPFIKATYLRADTEELIAKLSAEVRANQVVADVVEGTGVGEEAVKGGFSQPYFTPMLADMPQHYRDPHENWTPTRISYFGTAYNTKLVPADQVPKTYDDLLDPKWRGKLAWRVNTASGTPLFITMLRLTRGEDGAKAYLEKLKAQKIVNFGSGSARTLVDRVIAGEFAFALNIFAHHPLISRAKGAPVNSILMDPTPSSAATMIVPKGVRHPYSALLLVDYILSQEGQQILSKADYFPARADVQPLDALAPVVPKRAGVPELFVSSEDFNRYGESSQAMYLELFQ